MGNAIFIYNVCYKFGKIKEAIFLFMNYEKNIDLSLQFVIFSYVLSSGNVAHLR